MTSAARRQIIGGCVSLIKNRRRPQIDGGGGTVGAGLYLVGLVIFSLSEILRFFSVIFPCNGFRFLFFRLHKL